MFELYPMVKYKQYITCQYIDKRCMKYNEQYVCIYTMYKQCVKK